MRDVLGSELARRCPPRCGGDEASIVEQQSHLSRKVISIFVPTTLCSLPTSGAYINSDTRVYLGFSAISAQHEQPMSISILDFAIKEPSPDDFDGPKGTLEDCAQLLRQTKIWSAS